MKLEFRKNDKIFYVIVGLALLLIIAIYFYNSQKKIIEQYDGNPWKGHLWDSKIGKFWPPVKGEGEIFRPKNKTELKRAVDFWVNREDRRPGDVATVEKYYGNISDWDVSRVTDMSNLFFNITDFNDDITDWDVSKVTNMRQMFAYAKKFNQDISKWDVSKVTDMGTMFFHAASFNQDISQWNVSKVTDMISMFYTAVSFNKDISDWDVSNVKNMAYMFNNAVSFNQDISGWNVSKVTKMTDMFVNSKLGRLNGIKNPMEYFKSSQKDDSQQDPKYDFQQDPKVFDGIFKPKDKADLTTAVKLWFTNRSSANKQFGDISKWNVSSVTDMSELFKGIKNKESPDLSKWDTSQVTNMSKMIQYSYVNPKISNWNVSNVKDMSRMFNNAYDFNQNISGWQTDNVTNMYGMFYGAYDFNQDIRCWNVSKVTDMNDMFFAAYEMGKTFTTLPVRNTDATTSDIKAWFAGCPDTGLPGMDPKGMIPEMTLTGMDPKGMTPEMTSDMSDSCMTYDSRGICKRCKKGKYFTVDKKCVDTCPTGYEEKTWILGGVGYCVECECYNCKKPVDGKCKRCKKGKYLTVDKKCVDTCPTGYEEKTWILGGVGYCVAIPTKLSGLDCEKNYNLYKKFPTIYGSWARGSKGVPTRYISTVIHEGGKKIYVYTGLDDGYWKMVGYDFCETPPKRIDGRAVRAKKIEIDRSRVDEKLFGTKVYSQTSAHINKIIPNRWNNSLYKNIGPTNYNLILEKK